jgi:two-component system NtrC family sensor kinase
LILAMQLGCVAIGSTLLLRIRPLVGATQFTQLISIAGVVGVVTIIGWMLLSREHRSTLELARSIIEEREQKASLEKTVEVRTSELEEAQHALQRMWWLGQQIALELNPQRVLERFLEAVSDIAGADGGTVGLLGEDGNVQIVVATGSLSEYLGMTVPLSNSAMGGVIRSGVAWTVTDIQEHEHDLPPEVFERVRGKMRGVAIVPITRGGERIGAVNIVNRSERHFTTPDLERIESMSDLLSVSLENAELVETLRKAEWRFRTLFRAAPDAVFTVLQSGRIREANDAVREITGVEPRLSVGRDIVDLVAEEDRAPFQSALDATLSGRPSRVEAVFHRDEPGAFSKRIVAVAMSRLPEADPPALLLIARDVTTEREMRTRLMEADRLAAVGELVAGVAHEVNNPLSSISAFSQLMLRDETLTASQRDSLDVIKSETMRASQVVKDLLAFARRSEPHRELVDLNDVIARTLRLRGYQTTTSQITVETALCPDIPHVAGDARQLQQVCLNLVINAVQAMTPMGGGTLRILTSGDDRRVVMDVRDTGPGIPDRVRARIFEPFFTTKDEGEGTGLGLSVSYGIIAAHGGSIEAMESSSMGTTMRVTLPSCESL